MTGYCQRCVLIILWVGAICSPGSAQTSDTELWMGAEISKNITKKTSLRFEEQVRLNDNISSVKNFFSELGVAYKLNKYLRFSGNYRFKNIRRADGTFRTTNRFHGDIRFRYKAKPIIVLYRARLQVESGIRNKGPKTEYYDRNKLTLKLDLDKKFSPYMSSELYLDIKKGIFDKVRYTIGLDLNLKKRNEVSVFYRIQREFNVKKPNYNYVIGIGYSYRLKGRLIKKKKSSESAQ